MKKLTQEEFNNILHNHFIWCMYLMKDGIPLGKRADFIGTDLSEIKFGDALEHCTKRKLSGGLFSMGTYNAIKQIIFHEDPEVNQTIVKMLMDKCK